MKKAKDYIIFPLDVSTYAGAKKYITLLSEHVGMFKIGLELFIRSGPDIIRMIKNAGGAGIFLDFKFHDIPVTVSRAMASVAELDVDLATVHCGEAIGMLKAAVSGGRGKVGVLGVTLLTSLSGDDIRNSGYLEEFAADPSKLVMKKAAMAKSAGCRGVVCSGLEVEMIKSAFGEAFLAVTPGIRPGSGAVIEEDQQRVTTPAQAIKKGSDYLVIGRPIRDARDPLAAVLKIAEEIETVM